MRDKRKVFTVEDLLKAKAHFDKLPIPPSPKGPDISMWSEDAVYSNIQNILSDHLRDLHQKIDEIIFDKLREKGFDPTDRAYLKKHFFKYNFSTSPDWDHWMIKPVSGPEVHIVSIQNPVANLNPTGDIVNYRTTFNIAG